MRKFYWAAAALMALGGTGVANAQQQASSFLSGVSASQIKNVPLDTSKAIGQRPGDAALTGNRFNLGALFSRKPNTLYTPKQGISPLPPPSSFPSTHYQNFKMVGQPPFLLRWMFGNGQQSPIQPVAPIIPSEKTPVGPGSG